MSRLSEFFKKIEPIDSESIKANFQKLFNRYSFDAISVGPIFVDMEGNITVDFFDVDSKTMRVVFAYDDLGSYAMIANDSDDVLLFDLDPMQPVLRKTQGATYLDLTDSTWIRKSLLTALFSVGDVDSGANAFVNVRKDGTEVDPAFIPDSEPSPNENYQGTKINEGTRVIRGGKNIRMPVVMEKKRIQLTDSQKQNLAKSLMRLSDSKLSTSLRLTKQVVA